MALGLAKKLRLALSFNFSGRRESNDSETSVYVPEEVAVCCQASSHQDDRSIGRALGHSSAERRWLLGRARRPLAVLR